MSPPLAQLGDYFASGGGVMLPLALLSIWAWTLILLKAWQLASWRRQERATEEVVAEARTGRAGPGWQGELARLFLQKRTGRADLDRKLLHRMAHGFQDRAEKHLGTILTFAALAPLLGLLGTVMGMIGVFDTLAVQGTGSPRSLSAGISEALVSTQTGLLVAIPALFAGHFLRRRAQTFQDRMDRFCAALVREFLSTDNKGDRP